MTYPEMTRPRHKRARVTVEEVSRTRGPHDCFLAAVTRVYEQLSKLHRSFVGWSTARPEHSSGQPGYIEKLSQEYLRKRNADRFNEFLKAYYPQSIWLDRKTCSEIEAYIKRAKKFRHAFRCEISRAGAYNQNIQHKMEGLMNKELARKYEDITAKLQEALNC